MSRDGLYLECVACLIQYRDILAAGKEITAPSSASFSVSLQIPQTAQCSCGKSRTLPATFTSRDEGMCSLLVQYVVDVVGHKKSKLSMNDK